MPLPWLQIHLGTRQSSCRIQIHCMHPSQSWRVLAFQLLCLRLHRSDLSAKPKQLLREESCSIQHLKQDLIAIDSPRPTGKVIQHLMQWKLDITRRKKLTDNYRFLCYPNKTNGKNDGNISTQCQLINPELQTDGPLHVLETWIQCNTGTIHLVILSSRPPGWDVAIPGNLQFIQTWRVKPFRKEPCWHWPRGIHPIDIDPAGKWCRQSSASVTIKNDDQMWKGLKERIDLKTSPKC